MKWGFPLATQMEFHLEGEKPLSSYTNLHPRIVFNNVYLRRIKINSNFNIVHHKTIMDPS